MTASPRLPVGARIALPAPPNPFKEKYTTKVFSAPKTQAPHSTGKEEARGSIPKACFQEKKKENTYTPKRLQGICRGPLRAVSVYRFWPPKNPSPFPVVGNVTAALVRFFAACQGWAGLQCPVRGQRIITVQGDICVNFSERSATALVALKR